MESVVLLFVVAAGVLVLYLIKKAVSGKRPACVQEDYASECPDYIPSPCEKL